MPCIADPQPSILPAPACPDGLPQGSPVQGYLMGCVDQVGDVSAEAAAQLFETFVDGGRVYLYAVAALGRSDPRVAVLTNGERYRTIRTDNEGVTGVGSCDPQQLQDELARNDFVLNPVIPRPIP